MLSRSHELEGSGLDARRIRCVGIVFGANADRAGAADAGGQSVRIINQAFEKATGVKVIVHSDDSPPIVKQILAEGSRSPADVVYVENSTSINVLNEKGKLAKVYAKVYVTGLAWCCARMC